MAAVQFDIYQNVTDRIVAAIEAGVMPWLKPWAGGGPGGSLPYNAGSRREYHGINQIILGMSPYASLGWLTFKQAKEAGGNVRKGEHGTLIVFWKFTPRENPDTGKTEIIPMARAYTVFNTEQCDGLPERMTKAPTPAEKAEATSMDALAQSVGAIVRHGGDRAYYTTAGDFVALPPREAFKSADAYESTLAHELTHWTGHKSRCAREFGKRFGDMAYAFEELVAEIGSAFLCARHGIALEGLQHASYVDNWLQVLKQDKRAIFTAASQAKKAAEFLAASDEHEEEMQEAA